MMLCSIVISLLLQFLEAQGSPMVIYAQEGGTVTLPRDTPVTAENVYVNWYYGSVDKAPVISRNPLTGIQKGTWTRASLLPDFSLQISPVQDSDFEIFLCEQHVRKDNYIKTYKLYRVSIPKVPTVLFGDSLSLNCEVESSPVPTTVTWSPPKNSECEREITSYSGNTISVKDVSRCAGGVWTCEVKYENQKAKATTSVSVIDLAPSPPDPIYTSVSYSYSPTVDIPCSLSSNIPWAVVTNFSLQRGSWIFTPRSDQSQLLAVPLLILSVHPKTTWNITMNAQIAVQGRELKDQDLSIHKLLVSKKIRGEYTCSLKFMKKTLSRKVQVEVLQVQILQVPSSAGSSLYEGQSVNLTCTLGHPMTSDLEVKWKCPSCSTLPSLSSSPHPASLFIPEVRVQNSGKCICELWKNEKMLTSAELFLKIENVSVNIWLWVAISSGAVVFILLLVIVIIVIRRHKKMIMSRRHKTRFCCCKNPQPKGFYKT
ncbi:CD4-1 molecule isoform X2 [Xyrauchen texanus]|uniref:CD4-1 molecule isoform X2 n=1 Tax=Xyrauchen texanus TaxID=154827 RepID=UPI0022428C69|nr:CD4-1 molecule isoform X2 [Xyrauchen texanus]